MSPPILDSPLLNLITINTLLASPAPQTTQLRIQLLSAKIHLLTDQISLSNFDPPTSSSTIEAHPGQVKSSTVSKPVSNPITTSSSSSSRTSITTTASPTPVNVDSDPDHVMRRDRPQRDVRPELEIMRVRLALAKAYMDSTPSDYTNAESELSVVEKGTKGMTKRLTKRWKVRDDDVHQGDSESGLDVRGQEGQGRAQTQGRRLEEEEEEGEGAVDEGILDEVNRLRREALDAMISVEDGLGRETRAERWRKAIEEMDMAGR